MGVKSLLRLAMTALGIFLLILSVYYPRPFSEDATKSGIEDMVKSAMPKGREKEEIDRKLRKITKHRGTFEYSIGMPLEAMPGETGPSAEQSGPRVPSSPLERLMSAPPVIIIRSHRDGTVSGSIVNSDGKTHLEFSCSDNELPARITGQIRKFDLNRSKLFKAAYGILAALFCGTVGTYYRLRKKEAASKAQYDARSGSLQDYKSYRTVIKEGVLTRRESRAIMAGGDVGGFLEDLQGKPRYRFYWDDAVLAAIIVCSLIFGVCWRGYLNPKSQWPDKALAEFIDHQLARGGQIEAAQN